MNKKDKLKWMALGILLLTTAVVAVTFVIVSRLSQTAEKDHAKMEEEHLAVPDDGMLPNAYIVKNEDNNLIILYHGKKYIAKETAETNYTGVADILLSNGKIVKIYAKSGNVKGTLASYSDKSIQIEGYEVLSREAEMPVYKIATDIRAEEAVREGRLSDLVIGNSTVELVVANQKACAIICYQNEIADNIRVLIKNKEQTCYPDILVSSNKKFTVDGEEQKKNTLVSAEMLLNKEKSGKEIRISPQDGGMLFLCDSKGKRQGEGYEGDMIYRKAKDGYILINELPIEDYVRYVLPSEMPISFDYEALKAQAVCARTFAYKQMRGNAYAEYGANLDNTTSFQVYHAAGCYDITDRAVSDTRGMVLTYQGELVDCYYYSTSPGYSESLEVWQKDSPGYLTAENHTKGRTVNLSRKRAFHRFIKKKTDAYDENSPYFRWTATISSKLGMDEQYGRLKKIKINKRSKSGYILSLTMVFEDGEKTLERENDIRFALGKYLLSLKLADGTKKTGISSVPSACFEIKSQKNGTITLTGGGFGHGIGLSQYGANGMGCEGKKWQEILSYYYKNTEISNVFDLDTETDSVLE